MRLPSERDLALSFGVSRPAVREALRMLQFMGVVQMKPGTSGALLPDGKMDVLSDSLTLVLDLNSLTHRDVVRVRLVLEPLAAELAATEREPKHLRSMAEVVEGMRAGRYQGADFSAANAHFHVTIGEASGNILIATVMKAVSRLIFRNSEKYVRTEEVRQLVLRSHLATYQAIADGDPQRARAEVEALLGEQVRFVEASASVDMPPSEAGEATKPAQRPAAASAAVTKHPSSLEAE